MGEVAGGTGDGWDAEAGNSPSWAMHMMICKRTSGEAAFKGTGMAAAGGTGFFGAMG
jgi:hypothetical protein